MKNILIIKNPSFDCQETVLLLEELNTKVWYADHLNNTSHLIHKKKISLIIVLAEHQSNVDELSDVSIPHHIPVLIMHPLVKQLDVRLWPLNSQFIDIYQPPLTKHLLQQKLELFELIVKQSQDLRNTQNEKSALEKKIDDLHESVEGHNTFLDLMSRRDGLTGLFNRRHFNSLIQEEFTRASEEMDDLSLLILNIDYFNEINKSCGQNFGDFVLNEFSARITNDTRNEDFCFRYSGEDFAILMPSTSIEKAYETAEDLRRICENKPFNNGSYIRKATISIGLASVVAHSPASHDELINMADQALFLAKSEGRNCSSIYSPADRRHTVTSEQNFKYLQDTISRILEKTKDSTIRSLQLLSQGIMEGNDSSHIQQAKDYAQLLSQHLHLPPPIIDTFKNAIALNTSIRHLLHNDIINKKGSLSKSEWDVISDLPYKLVELTQLFDYFSHERSILLYHGERYDGSGYPEGLKGDEIPLGARIFNLVNALAAMNSNKPHRARLQPPQILKELAENAGKQFDPFLVLKLIDIIEKKSILDIDSTILDSSRQTILLNNPSVTNNVKI